VRFVKDRIRPVSEEEVRRCLKELDDDRFEVREKATLELDRLGKFIVPAIKKELAKALPLDPRRRLERVLARAESEELSADQRRELRTLEVLEQVGTAEAKAVLKVIAKGRRTPN
jgi:hypothetical protein